MEDKLHNEFCPTCKHIVRTFITEPGEHCVCFTCSELLLMTDELKLRVMTESEALEISNRIGDLKTFNMSEDDYIKMIEFAKVINQIEVKSNPENE